MNLSYNRHIIRKSYTSLLLVFSVLALSFAQEGQNPFEISGRATSEQNTTPITTPKAANSTDTIKTVEALPMPPIILNSDNPFEVNNASSPTPKVKTKKKKETTLLSTGSLTEEEAASSKSFLFIIIMIMMVLFAALITLFREYVGKTYEAFINNSQMNAIYRELGSTIPFHYLVLYFMFFVNVAIFLYLLLKHKQIQFSSNWGMLLTLLAAVGTVFLIKHTLLKVISWVFPISKEVDLYNFSIIIFNIVIGILLIPFNLLMAYAPNTLTSSLLYIIAFSIFAIFLYRSFRGLLIGSKYLSMHKFHFFMYLCTIEIIPVIILVKFIKNLM